MGLPPLDKPEDLLKAMENAVQKQLNNLNLKAKNDPKEIFREELKILYLQRVFNVILQIMKDGNVSTACNKANAEKGGLTTGSAKIGDRREKRAAAANRKDRATIEKVVRESLKRLKVKK